MAMLAEPRRKQRWTLNPRGKHWSDDSNKFGQKMLEKMGWSNGKGLGANLDGMTEHIRLKYKADQAGVGFSNADRDKQWTQHQEGFNELLQKLHNTEEESTPAVENELSGKSLELKSKQSRARVHYQKFTRGKDVNKYSAKDLANIFGKKNLDEKPEETEKISEIKRESIETIAEPIGSCDTSHGVVTIKGGSISDYFKNKISVLSRKVTSEVSHETDSETETRVGFGFSNNREKFENPKNSSETNYSFVNPALNIASPKEDNDKPRNSEFAFENPGLDIASPKDDKNTPRKRKNEFVFDNPGLELGDVTNETEKTSKKRRTDFAFENGGLDLECAQNGGSTDAITSNDDGTKKKRKKKVKECIPHVVDGIANEALNLNVQNEEITNSNEFEVPRIRLGLANDALDLTDETNGRKRVTFNDAVEYETDSNSGKRKNKKNKNSGKLDKFEVDNEKLKRKKKKNRKNEIVESAFVNTAMDVDATSQEASENAANERKSERARRKRDRRTSNLETINEVPDEDRPSFVEVVTLDDSFIVQANDDTRVSEVKATEKKKNKKKKRRENEKIGETESNVNTTIDISQEDEEMIAKIVSAGDEKNLEENLSRESEIGDGNENVKNIKKKKKKKKKDSSVDEEEKMEAEEIRHEDSEATKVGKTKKNRMTEDSKENVDTENVATSMNISEDVESVKKTKKRRKERKNCDVEDEVAKVNEVDDKLVEERLENVGQNPWDSRVQKSKKSFKALFARSPIVNFVGSNINEIKGYGVDLK